MSEEKGKNIYVLDDESKIDFEKSGHDFDIMPDEFFNSQYQQSRVRKEQQMQKEKDLIDRKKKEKEERLKKLSELEKQRKEKDELKKERERIREDERKKKQVELDVVNAKRKEENEKIRQEQEKLRLEREATNKRKSDKERKLRELDQKAKEERRSLKKDQKELLRQELEKRAEILKAQNSNSNEDVKNKEVEKALAKDRSEILRRIKLEQKLNSKEQKRIKKEVMEESRVQEEEARDKAIAEAKMMIGKSHKSSINFGFLDKNDDGRLSILSDSKKKKKLIIISTYIVAFSSFVLFILIQTNIINLKESNTKDNQNNTNTNNVDSGPKLTDDPIKVDDTKVENNPDTTIDNTSSNSTAVSESGNVLDYSYKYPFSKYFDFFKYSVNQDSIGSYLSPSERVYYGAYDGVIDSDNDSHIDGDEVMNMYDPSPKNNGESTDQRLIDTGKIVSYDFESVSFYYPLNFTLSNESDGSLKLSSDLSEEYISFKSIQYDASVGFIEFLKQDDLKSSNFYRIKNFVNNIGNDFFADDTGHNVYLDLHNGKILKVSYVIPTESSNYVATFLMVLKSIVVK